jgi:sulfite exporter TauE/SafE
VLQAFVLGFAIGLPGSLHCLGMCGPLALMVGTGKRNPRLSAILYHTSRAIAYSLLGIFVGLIFQWVDIRPYQQQFSLGIGLLFLLAWVFSKLQFSIMSIQLLNFKFLNELPNLLTADNSVSMILGGLINGLLPCGLVYSALIASLSTGYTLSASVFMLGFGISTIPMMMIVSLISLPLKMKMSRLFSLITNWWLLIMAVIFLLRGAGIGIPLISPDFGSANPQENCCTPH